MEKNDKVLSACINNLGSINNLEFRSCCTIPTNGVNVVKGSNGTGKSLLLDSIWYALTKSDGGTHFLRPTLSQQDSSAISVSCCGGKDYSLKWNRKSQDWASSGEKRYPGIILYMRSDGGFSLWDSARTRVITTKDEGSLVFSAHTIDVGLSEVRGTTYCRGMYYDCTFWNMCRDEPASKMFCDLVHCLLGYSVGPSVRYSLYNSRKVPTLLISGAADPVPIHLAGSFALRWFRMAYLLTWEVQEHLRYREHFGDSENVPLLVLVDDIEKHSDKNNRTSVLKNLLSSVLSLSSSVDGIQDQPQIIVTTRSTRAVYECSNLTSLDPPYGRTEKTEEKVDRV